MCLCFSHISPSYLSYSCVFVSFCLLCVALSLLSEPPHTVAKSWLRTGGFLLSHFVWAVAQREIVKGLARMGTGLAGEQSRGQAETRIPAPALPHVMEDPGLVLTSPALLL